MSEETETTDDLKKVICPNCMAANSEYDHFCTACQTPLTTHAATDPLKSISARMDTFNKATKHARHPVVVVGMWLIFGPTLVVCIIGLGSLFNDVLMANSLINPRPVNLIGLLVAAILFGGLGLIAFVLLKRTTSSWLNSNLPAAAGEMEKEDEDDALTKAAMAVAEEDGKQRDDDSEGKPE